MADVEGHLRRHPDLVRAYVSELVTASELADLLGVDARSLRRVLSRILEEPSQVGVVAEDAAWLLGWDLDPQIRTHRCFDDARPLLRDLTMRFVAFEERFFKLPDGKPFIRKPFHLRWIDALLWAMMAGRKQLILSPPRHGKSQLLSHLSVWLIARNRNIRILWIGPNADIAEDMAGSVRQHLEDNEDLIATYGEFAPSKKSGLPWRNSIFTVQGRTTIQKSPTMVAIGRTSKILSRDVDLLVADDLEDHVTTENESSREKTRRWFLTQLDSRKESHTGFVVIGSRQHPRDLYRVLLDTPSWADTAIVESAHDPNCTLPQDDLDAHWDCMLFPEKNNYRWLRDKQISAERAGAEGLFEMVYLNKPRPEGTLLFVREEIEACFNHDRSCGLDGLPATYRLIAGLDPSATGYQAAFLWAWSADAAEHPILYAVDLENHKGGGFDHALRIIKDWHQRYGCQEWVIEENLYHGALRQHPPIVQYCADYGIKLRGHQTTVNKRDPVFGVGGMAEWFRQRRIDLPYGDPDARHKTQQYLLQLLDFTDVTATQIRKRNRPSDILMASWFPMETIRTWGKELEATLIPDYDPLYPGWDLTPLDDVPWQRQRPRPS